MPNQSRIPKSWLAASAAACLLAVYSLLLWTGWRKWPDVFIDFGREIYLPWQMLEGRIIYRDIDHVFGPLSVFFNALVFKISGGPSLTALLAVNVLLSALFLTLIFAVLLRRAGLLSAWFGVLCAIILNILPHQTQVGNFNFITPYSHEAIHGVMLSFAALFLLWGRDGVRPSRISFSGLLFGMVLMTKPEVSAACLAACLWQIIVRRIPDKDRLRGSLRDAALFSVCALAAPLAFLAYFTLNMGVGEAFAAIFGQWTIIFSGAFASNVFYAVGAGLDKPLEHLSSAGFGLLVIWVPYFLASRKRGSRQFRLMIGIFLFVLTALFSRRIFEKTFIFIDVGFALLLLRDYLSGRDQKSLDYSSLAVLASALMGKLGLAGRFYNYGFYLALPTVILLAVMTLDYLPARVVDNEGPVGARAVKALSLLLLSGMLVSGSYVSIGHYMSRTVEVGPPGDPIVTFDRSADERGFIAHGVYEWLTANAKKGSTLTVFPEGMLINVWTGMASPARQLIFLPAEAETYGEDRLVADLAANPPDYVVIWRRDASAYGKEPFGEGSYGSEILDWIKSAYLPVALVGKNEPDLSKSGAIILARKRN